MYNREDYERLKREIQLERSMQPIEDNSSTTTQSQDTTNVSASNREVYVLFTIDVEGIGEYPLKFFKYCV